MIELKICILSVTAYLLYLIHELRRLCENSSLETRRPSLDSNSSFWTFQSWADSPILINLRWPSAFTILERDVYALIIGK